jgi:hypothetical protein
MTAGVGGSRHLSHSGRLLLLAQLLGGTFSPRFWPGDFLPDGPICSPQTQKWMSFCPTTMMRAEKPRKSGLMAPENWA